MLFCAIVFFCYFRPANPSMKQGVDIFRFATQSFNSFTHDLRSLGIIDTHIYIHKDKSHMTRALGNNCSNKVVSNVAPEKRSCYILDLIIEACVCARVFRVNRICSWIWFEFAHQHSNVQCLYTFLEQQQKTALAFLSSTKYVREMFAFFEYDLDFCFRVVFRFVLPLLLFFFCFTCSVCLWVCVYMLFVYFVRAFLIWFKFGLLFYALSLVLCYNDAFARSIDTQMHKEWETTLSHCKSTKNLHRFLFVVHSFFVYIA